MFNILSSVIGSKNSSNLFSQSGVSQSQPWIWVSLTCCGLHRFTESSDWFTAVWPDVISLTLFLQRRLESLFLNIVVVTDWTIRTSNYSVKKQGLLNKTRFTKGKRWVFCGINRVYLKTNLQKKGPGCYFLKKLLGFVGGKLSWVAVVSPFVRAWRKG